MKYYRVKSEFDNFPRFKIGRDGKLLQDSILIARELYTPHERSKFANRDEQFEAVEVSKNETYFSFGARFAMCPPHMSK